MCAIDGVRHVRKEIPADCKKYLHLSLEHRVQSLNRVITPLLGWRKVERFPKSFQKSLRRALPHTHGAVALNIRVATHANGPRAGAADISSNKQKIHDHRNVVDAVAVLCNA